MSNPKLILLWLISTVRQSILKPLTACVSNPERRNRQFHGAC